MKKTLIVAFIISTAFQLTSCKVDKKKEVVQKKEVENSAYSLKTAKNTVDWVAYKTTDKLPVKGKFKKVNITKNGEGNTAKDAINGAEFSIPVSSLFTADLSRDFKLKKFFFGFMDNTKLLSGTLIINDETNGTAAITMNGITKDLAFTYALEGKKFKMNATMNLDDWNAQKAVESLNIACKDLHKATDGISKTWNEVAINITSVFQ